METDKIFKDAENYLAQKENEQILTKSDSLNEKSKKITKIVVTGGPCAGKTTALSKLNKYFKSKGYTVLNAEEAATDLITAGVTPWNCEDYIEFQAEVIKNQIHKEKLLEKAALNIKDSDKVLIVCDRGTVDNFAYTTPEQKAELLKRLDLKEEQMKNDYEAVFHLVTAAKGAKDYYTLANNAARTETEKEAIELDDKTMAAWTGHPHLRVIDNSVDFEEKVSKLIDEISAVLGEPKPYEIERKYLIKMPPLAALEKSPFCAKLEIIQTYLKSTNPHQETRIRQSGRENDYIYTKTTKTEITGLKRIETEKRISKNEYVNLLMEADTTKKQIRKTRYRFIYSNQYFEIDVYPFWKDKAIMEIELKDENQKVALPKFIEVIKEVTNDKNYKNSHIANNLGKDL